MTPEGFVKKAIEDLLKAEGVHYWRMNAGDRLGFSNGKKWRIRGHETGTADFLASITLAEKAQPHFVWIEAKAPNGKQSSEQISFQEARENDHHIYLLIDDVAQLQTWLKENT